jgi:hypothetical protein
MRSLNRWKDTYFNTENIETVDSIAFHDFRQFVPKSERTEPVFLNVYGAQELIPPAYVAWRARTITLFLLGY